MSRDDGMMNMTYVVHTRGEAQKQTLTCCMRIEQENQVINLYGKTNAQWDMEAVEEEIRAALKSSLKKKVGSLEDDRWMFEGEGEGRK